MRNAATLARLLTAGMILRLAADLAAEDASSLTNRADEPLRVTFSVARAAEGLDAIPRDWKATQCVTCHLQPSYLMARPAFSADVPMYEEMLHSLERGATKALAPKPSKQDVTTVVLAAVALARHDARLGGTLRPVTRQTLDRMWDLQQEDGSWDWAISQSRFSACDLHFGACLAALAAGIAPERYAETPKAIAGLDKVRRYLKQHPPTSLHQRAMLLLASRRVAGIATAEQGQQTSAELWSAQQSDGGWSATTLLAPGDRPADLQGQAVSDGYGTGFVVYVLREAADAPAGDPRLRRAVAWLKTHQRASGRWFTPSLSGKKRNVISLEGTAWAIVALNACGALTDAQP